MHFCAVTMNSEPFEMGWLSLKTFQKGDMNLIWAKRTQTKCANTQTILLVLIFKLIPDGHV